MISKKTRAGKKKAGRPQPAPVPSEPEELEPKRAVHPLLYDREFLDALHTLQQGALRDQVRSGHVFTTTVITPMDIPYTATSDPAEFFQLKKAAGAGRYPHERKNLTTGKTDIVDLPVKPKPRAQPSMPVGRRPHSLRQKIWDDVNDVKREQKTDSERARYLSNRLGKKVSRSLVRDVRLNGLDTPKRKALHSSRLAPKKNA